MVKFRLIQKMELQMIVAILIALCAVLICIGFFKLTWSFWTGTLGLHLDIPFIGNKP